MRLDDALQSELAKWRSGQLTVRRASSRVSEFGNMGGSLLRGNQAEARARLRASARSLEQTCSLSSVGSEETSRRRPTLASQLDSSQVDELVDDEENEAAYQLNNNSVTPPVFRRSRRMSIA